MDQSIHFLTEWKNEVVAFYQNAAIEIINCAREACWEADIIITTHPHPNEPQLAAMIKEVSVGKIVLLLQTKQGNDTQSSVIENSKSILDKWQQLLPHSKFVLVYKKIEETIDAPAVITGEDQEAVSYIQHLFCQVASTTGFKNNQFNNNY